MAPNPATLLLVYSKRTSVFKSCDGSSQMALLRAFLIHSNNLKAFYEHSVSE